MDNFCGWPQADPIFFASAPSRTGLNVIMDYAIIGCQEEEFAPFLAWPGRRRAGWRVVWCYGRGPSGIGVIAGMLLTAVGVWRFARPPATLAAHSGEFLGRRVRAIDLCLGSYGMGGPAFFGLRFDHGWIVYRLWNAASWLTLNGQLLAESLAPFPEERQAIGEQNLISARELIGTQLRALESDGTQYNLVFACGDGELDAGEFRLSLRRDGATVPCYRRTGSPKVFAASESLEEAIVVSRTARLWLTS